MIMVNCGQFVLLNRIFWESKNFEGCTSMIEPWYGTAYSVEKISDGIIQVFCPSKALCYNFSSLKLLRSLS